MRPSLLLILIGVIASFGFAPVPPPRERLSRDDYKNMKGLWLVTRYERSGQPVGTKTRVLQVRIEGQTWTFISTDQGMAKKSTAYHLELDQKDSPKAFGWRGQSSTVLQWVGSYLIERDRLTMVFKSGSNLKDRSTDLTNPQPNDYIMILKRESK